MQQNFNSAGSHVLRGLPFLKPPLPEQSRIASVLSASDEAIEKEQDYKNKLLALKRGLMEDLLTGKVRVTELINDEQDKELKRRFQKLPSEIKQKKTLTLEEAFQ